MSSRKILPIDFIRISSEIELCGINLEPKICFSLKLQKARELIFKLINDLFRRKCLHKIFGNRCYPDFFRNLDSLQNQEFSITLLILSILFNV